MTSASRPKARNATGQQSARSRREHGAESRSESAGSPRAAEGGWRRRGQANQRYAGTIARSANAQGSANRIGVSGAGGGQNGRRGVVPCIEEVRRTRDERTRDTGVGAEARELDEVGFASQSGRGGGVARKCGGQRADQLRRGAVHGRDVVRGLEVAAQRVAGLVVVAGDVTGREVGLGQRAQSSARCLVRA